jgi:hypothetical protein
LQYFFRQESQFVSQLTTTMQETDLPMWTTTSILPDPLTSHNKERDDAQVSSSIVTATISIQELLRDESTLSIFKEAGRGARVSLADFAARQVNDQRDKASVEIDGHSVHLEPLDFAVTKTRRRKAKRNGVYPPYVLERTDVWCSETEIHVMLRMVVRMSPVVVANDSSMAVDHEKKSEESVLESAAASILTNILRPKDAELTLKIMTHVACVALQQRIRSQLSSIKAVAFVADGSILPRKSGTSDAPMSSPPAVISKAPPDSSMSQHITIEMGSLANHLPPSMHSGAGSSVTFRGLAVPTGITLICGGGYHGKSTLLGTIAVGIYDKIPGDGRELCVAVNDAVTVRAEDGRYVNNCNISAFISNLPTPPGVTKTLDTQHFSSRDSSGSTSQAANVAEAIEMGATAMLVDEDVSAANFMARDGRMRALVMDESITPLLYRVNGMYNTRGISSVVVVGGVGDWLDVPHKVILLDKYVASDATKKAQSISYQFSYGHVQYGGQGVVHKLEWEKSGTPTPRRPADSFSSRFANDVVISLLDGGHALSLHQDESAMEDDGMDIAAGIDDDDEGCIEASRLEQLLGRKQLYGCGLCVSWMLQAAPKHPKLGIPALLKKLDEVIDNGGMVQVVKELNASSDTDLPSETWKHLVEAVGFAERPRKHEIAQALTRMHGIQMEVLPVEDDGEDAAVQLAEQKKQALAALWANRRKT